MGNCPIKLSVLNIQVSFQKNFEVLENNWLNRTSLLEHKCHNE